MEHDGHEFRSFQEKVDEFEQVLKEFEDQQARDKENDAHQKGNQPGSATFSVPTSAMATASRLGTEPLPRTTLGDMDVNSSADGIRNGPKSDQQTSGPKNAKKPDKARRQRSSSGGNTRSSRSTSASPAPDQENRSTQSPVQLDNGTEADEADASNGGRKSRRAKKTLPRIPKFPKFPNPPNKETQDATTTGFEGSRDTPAPSSNSDDGNQQSDKGTTLRPGEIRGEKEKRTAGRQEPRSSSQSSSSSYDRPWLEKQEKHVCLDITSFRFIPEDRNRVDMVLRKIVGDRQTKISDTFSNDTHKEEIHDFPMVSSEEITGIPLKDAPGAITDVDNKKFITLTEFASLRPSIAQTFRSIPKKDAVPFVLIYKDARKVLTDYRWENPDFQRAADFVNELLCAMYEIDDLCHTAYIRTGKWGLFTIVYLNPNNSDHFNGFRKKAASTPLKGSAYDLYPKDALTLRTDIEILMRSSMLNFKTSMIPKVLFTRNKLELAGSIRVMATKFFDAQDTSLKGESKQDWRLISLKSDDQFLRCLRLFPESKPFLLGVDSVQIRGGLRPPEPAVLGKRIWAGQNQNKLAGTPLLSSTSPSTPSLNTFPNTLPLQFPPLLPSSAITQPGQAGPDTPKRGRSANRRGRGRYKK